MKKYFLAVFILSAFFVLGNSCVFAEFPLVEKGFYLGYGRSEELKETKAHYEPIIIAGRLGWDLNAFFGDKLPGELIATVEPFLNPILKPNDNVEFGTHFMLKYGYRFDKFMPYIEGGSGLMYTSQHVREQGTQFNFSDQAGVGFYWFFEDNVALNLGYRFRHFSNLGIEDPNGGVDIHSGFAGISWFID